MVRWSTFPGLLLVAAALVGTGCRARGDRPVELMAYVGSASGPAVEECARAFAEETGVQVAVELGGSGALLSKLQLAERGDLYIPGSPDYMMRAQELVLVREDSIRRLAFLVPAIVVPRGNPAEIGALEDLARPDLRIGIGDPRTVCVGVYAVEIIEGAGLAETIRPNVVAHSPSCSGTAGLVALDTVDAVLGWRVFEAWTPEELQAIPVTPAQLPRLGEIPAAVTQVSQHPDEAARFIEYLVGPSGRAVFTEHGYLVDEDEARVFAPDATIGGVYDPPAGW